MAFLKKQLSIRYLFTKKKKSNKENTIVYVYFKQLKVMLYYKHNFNYLFKVFNSLQKKRKITEIYYKLVTDQYTM